MTFRSLLAATCLALPLAAHAAPVTGPYVSLGFGTSILSTENYKYTNDNFGGREYTRPDYAGAMDFGYGFGNGFRAQLGVNFDRNTYHKFVTQDATTGQLSGGMNRYGVMANVLYDLPLGLIVTPYVGAGAGYQWEKLERVSYGSGWLGGTAGSFAYDVIAGASYDIPHVPGLAVTAEYRFMQLTGSRKFSDTGSSTFDYGQDNSHTFLLGLRYQIFAPPPALPVAQAPAEITPPPAPLPARTFLVFFDWDKAALTPRATEIISEAASDSKTASVTTLDVSGYTDTSGTADYNMGLSERRAKAVAAQLESDGVPASEIEIHAYGETHLLVATGPGVREPQNRRVEIVLH